MVSGSQRCAVAGAEPALEVDAPDVVRRRHRPQNGRRTGQARRRRRRGRLSPSRRSRSPIVLAAGQTTAGPLAQQHRPHLLRPPVRMRAAASRRSPRPAHPADLRRPMRRPRPVGQPAEAGRRGSVPATCSRSCGSPRSARHSAVIVISPRSHSATNRTRSSIDAGLFPRHRQGPPCRP